MCPMTVAEVSLPGTAITSILMADPIPTTSGQETGITQPIREAPVDGAEVAVLARVPVPALAVAVLVVARKIPMVK